MALTQPAPFFAWVDRQGKPAPAPLAWTGGWLELLMPAEQWGELDLSLEGQPLPLLLSQSGGQRHLLAQWPALSAGFCQLSLSDAAGQQLASEAIFVGTPQLSQTQWLALLNQLRYRLPARLLLAAQRLPGGRVPVSLGALPHDFDEERALLLAWLEGSASQPGLFTALERLDAHPLRTPALRGQWQPLHRSRRPDPRQLLRGALSPWAPTWDMRPELQLDTPENRFVAGVVAEVRQHLHQFQQHARQTGEFTTAAAFAQAAHRLGRRWQRHAFAQLRPQLELPSHAQIFRLPGYAACLRIWQALRRGWQPQMPSDYGLPYGDLALLYQHFCLLALSEALLAWGRAGGWELDGLQLSLRRGRPLLRLRRGELSLAAIPEASYGREGELISLSRTQRPDLSLLLRAPGQAPQLIVLDAKFRSEAGQPLKDDLDKLHAYRDAIRRYDGSPVVSRAVLLYPGAPGAYLPALEAWQILPAASDAPLSPGLIASLAELLSSAMLKFA